MVVESFFCESEDHSPRDGVVHQAGVHDRRPQIDHGPQRRHVECDGRFQQLRGCDRREQALRIGQIDDGGGSAAVGGGGGWGGGDRGSFLGGDGGSPGDVDRRDGTDVGSDGVDAAEVAQNLWADATVGHDSVAAAGGLVFC